MKNLVIFGTGGVGRALRFFVEDVNRKSATWRLLGYVDETSATHGTEVHGLPVLGSIEWLLEHL